MADVSSVYLGWQLGAEVTPGTGVAANRLMQSFGMGRMQGQGSGTPFRPQGSKLNTIIVPPGRRWMTTPIDGVMTYNEIVYLLCSALRSVTPTADGTNGKKWTFTLSKSAPDVKQTYTGENGSSVHAQKAAYMQVQSLQLEMSPESNKLSGSFIGQQIQDDIAMTGSPTEIDPIIIAPQALEVKVADTQAGLTGASVFTRPFMATLSIDNIVAPLNRMNAADASYVALIEQAPTISLKLTVGADDADMVFLTNLTAGSTKFIRVQALGAVIAGAIPSAYAFQLDFSGKVPDHYNPGDRAGVATSEWTFQANYDVTWTKAFELFVVNTLATL